MMRSRKNGKVCDQLAICDMGVLPSICEPYSRQQLPVVSDPCRLGEMLSLPPTIVEQAKEAARRLPMALPAALLPQIKPGDPEDPVLLQFLPRVQELNRADGFTADPLQESRFMVAPRVVQKYSGRVLVLASDRCAAACRFCFRRHRLCRSGSATGVGPATPGACGGQSCGPAGLIEELRAGLRWIAQQRSVVEVILSGGDPLVLSDVMLEWILRQLGQMPHVRRVRIHTRVPVLWPQRVTSQLIELLANSRPTLFVVVHVNCAEELSSRARDALLRFSDAGLPVLSQTVLLRGVNDQVERLEKLFETLADYRVVPYYLHQLDKVAGASHFEVPVAEGIKLVEELRRHLPGYAVPRYVCEVPGMACKKVLA